METVRVLIVDDEMGMRLGAARVLQKTEETIPALDLRVTFTCETAATGREAIEKLAKYEYDLLLLDYKLPDISGFEVLEELKTREIEITTVMMTAYASLEIAVSATKNGTFDFLAKPFSPEELESISLKAATNLLVERHAKKLVEEKRKVRFEFISVLSHELKSPIAAVESYLSLLKSRAQGEDISNYDKILDRALIRLCGMRQLILDLLDLTRIESNEKSRTVDRTDVAELLKQCVETIREEANRRNIGVTIDGPDALPFRCDASEFQMICNNLLSNAVKYNRDNGRVFVSLAMEGNRLTLKVTDTGIGIDKVNHGRLFKAFSRVKNQHTEHIQGSGLGLSILKNLVQLYDGTVTFESEPDKGSAFTVTLQEG